MFETSPTDKNLTRMETLELFCRADGYPIPTIVWLHNSTFVDEDTEITTEVCMGTAVCSTLSVRFTSFINSGEYLCMAISPVDTFHNVISDAAYIIIQGEFRDS